MQLLTVNVVIDKFFNLKFSNIEDSRVVLDGIHSARQFNFGLGCSSGEPLRVVMK